MKKYVKLVLIIFVVIYFAWILGARVPFIANHARGQIKNGMSIAQVIGIITSYSKKPDICRWEGYGIAKPISSIHGECVFPKKDQLMPEKRGENIKLSITFIGPGFLHNDFHIIFDRSGNVSSVSDVKSWD